MGGIIEEKKIGKKYILDSGGVSTSSPTRFPVVRVVGSLAPPGTRQIIHTHYEPSLHPSMHEYIYTQLIIILVDIISPQPRMYMSNPS